MPALKKSPPLIKALRPSREEVDSYSRLILKHERRPMSALPDCQREAELQLWATRSLEERRAQIEPAAAEYADARY